jgi:hypothetical protein
MSEVGAAYQSPASNLQFPSRIRVVARSVVGDEAIFLHNPMRLLRILRLRCAPLTPCPRSGGALGGTLAMTLFITL